MLVVSKVLVVSFLQGGDLLIGILRAERDAEFDLHLSVTCELMPWLWAAGRHTYAKFIPTYIAEMRAMEVSQSESYVHMQNGVFVVRRAANHAFNSSQRSSLALADYQAYNS